MMRELAARLCLTGCVVLVVSACLDGSDGARPSSATGDGGGVIPGSACRPRVLVDASVDGAPSLDECQVRERLEGALSWLEQASVDGYGGGPVQLVGDFYIRQYGLNIFEQTVAESFKGTGICVVGCFTFFGCSNTGSDPAVAAPRVIETLECICPCPDGAGETLNLISDGTVDRAIELIRQLLAQAPSCPCG